MKILMVCLGNICRSPTAEGALRAEAARRNLNLHVESRGTAHWHQGKPADERTVRHAKQRGLDLSKHRAQQVHSSDYDFFDRIYAMDGSNLRFLLEKCPEEHRHKLFLLLGDGDVPDPWSGGPADFERVLDLCEAAAQRILDGLPTRS